MIRKMALGALAASMLAIAAFITGVTSERSAQAAGIGCPPFTYGLVLTAGQWQACFDGKQNVLNYTPVNKAGDTLTGKLTFPVSTVSNASLNVPQGSAPTVPSNGDMWVTTTGLFVRANNITNGPIRGTAVYDNAGTIQNGQHIVTGSATLSGGTVTVSLTGAAVFTNNTTFNCWVGDKSGTAAATSITLTSGSSIALKGTTTNSVGYFCIGS